MTTTPRTTDVTQFEHRALDGSRELRFNGKLLAATSSRKPGKQRWAEFALYRTTNGKYVLAGVGRSEIVGEVDKHWALVSDDPQAVIERLTMYDDNESRYIPSVGQKLLAQAGLADDGIRRAFGVEFIE